MRQFAYIDFSKLCVRKIETFDKIEAQIIKFVVLQFSMIEKNILKSLCFSKVVAAFNYLVFIFD